MEVHRSTEYLEELRKVLADPRAHGPGYDKLRQEYQRLSALLVNHSRDATYLGAQEADRIDAERAKNDARRKAEAEQYNREWEARERRRRESSGAGVRATGPTGPTGPSHQGLGDWAEDMKAKRNRQYPETDRMAAEIVKASQKDKPAPSEEDWKAHSHTREEWEKYLNDYEKETRRRSKRAEKRRRLLG